MKDYSKDWEKYTECEFQEEIKTKQKRNCNDKTRTDKAKKISISRRTKFRRPY